MQPYKEFADAMLEVADHDHESLEALLTQARDQSLEYGPAVDLGETFRNGIREGSKSASGPRRQQARGRNSRFVVSIAEHLAQVLSPMSRSVIHILLWPTPGPPALGLPAYSSKRSFPSIPISGLQRRTREPTNGSLATRRPSPQTPMNHGDKSIRLAAHRSECSTRIYAEAGATNCPTAHNECVGAYGSDSLHTSLWVGVAAKRPPMRE